MQDIYKEGMGIKNPRKLNILVGLLPGHHSCRQHQAGFYTQLQSLPGYKGLWWEQISCIFLYNSHNHLFFLDTSNIALECTPFSNTMFVECNPLYLNTPIYLRILQCNFLHWG